MFKTHLAFSFLCSIFLWPLFSSSGIPKWAFVVVFLFVALLPDIDNTSSFLGKHVKIIGWLFRHRGIFHSIFPAIIISFPVYLFLGYGYALAIMLGYLSHLVLDMLNYQGVSLFSPVLKWRIKGFCKSGSLFEKVLFLVCLVGIVFVTIKTG